MKTVAIIPARYNSSRFRAKPLADICGRPMIWWVCRQVRRCRRIDRVTVATDNDLILEECRRLGIDALMTSQHHRTSTERIWEAAQQIPADVYVCVNGDEPLIDPETVEQVIPQSPDGFFAANLMVPIHDPVQAIDESNIKVVTDAQGYALFFSRSPIPHPKASIRFEYYKHLGVLAYTAEALRFFAQTERGENERIEDINELRFVEHGKRLQMIPVRADTRAVDTPKDLDHVRAVIGEKIEKGEIVL